MEKLKIKEKDEIQKFWYEDAKKMTLEELPEFLRHLTQDYEHDYGTICHALSAGAIATAWAMNRSDQGGITGFQAGAVMWEFVRHWSYPDNKAGLKIVDYDTMLYPQYDYHFTDRTISSHTWKTLQEEAKSNYYNNTTAHPDVKEHWKSIIEGNVPFGYTVEKEEK